ncbi:hypothetical protein P154DRAFT_625650 [Amniculicola lignicola CBS 123094]|uniref:Uncharacterized protein n=1 Tax=Amniculicola lignicola CBS 123094 TaxID=1392246 RepID=A0A6A5VUU0_9PLEO|nr:hypothetical protein P154DRAFT_625650 [Amniculicola lignicola CBS 123094]
MSSLPLAATSMQAQEASGLEFLQWIQFKRITQDEAHNIFNLHPNCTWATLEYGEKIRVQEQILSRLEKDNIPAVTGDVIRWRMSKALNALGRVPRRVAAAGAPTAATTDGTEPQASRNFDPVRDI